MRSDRRTHDAPTAAKTRVLKRLPLLRPQLSGTPPVATLSEFLFETISKNTVSSLVRQVSSVSAYAALGKELVRFAELADSKVQVPRNGKTLTLGAYTVSQTDLWVPIMAAPQFIESVQPFLEAPTPLLDAVRTLRGGATRCGIAWPAATAIIKKNVDELLSNDGKRSQRIGQSALDILAGRRSDVKERLMCLLEVLSEAPNASDREICAALDANHVSVLTSWSKLGAMTWATAVGHQKLRGRVHRMISGYRKICGNTKRP
jgi:hypothetical protein